MSYLVLARKYRPRNFAEMVGQEHVVQALSNALTQQRLHQMNERPAAQPLCLDQLRQRQILGAG